MATYLAVMTETTYVNDGDTVTAPAIVSTGDPAQDTPDASFFAIACNRSEIVRINMNWQGRNVRDPFLGDNLAILEFAGQIEFHWSTYRNRWQVKGGRELGNWAEDPNRDLVPLTTGQGIGSLDRSPRFIAVGENEPLGIEGMVVRRDPADGGGIGLFGYRNEDPAGSPNPTPNAPAEINGTQVIIDGDAVEFVLDNPITEDHYLILGPTYTLSDGRIVSPLKQGPKVIYTIEDETSNNNDHDLDQILETAIATLTLTNNYTAGAQFDMRALLSEEGGRSSQFHMVLYVDNVEVWRDESTNISGTNVYWSQTLDTGQPLNSGQVLELRAFYTASNPGSDAWVRGSLQPTVLRIQQSN